MNITIPSLGDIEEVEVIELCVAVGDTVAQDDTILVIESDKASMDLPSPAAGVIESIEVKVGDQIGEGHVIAVLQAAQETETEPPPEQASAEDQPAPDPQATTKVAQDMPTADTSDKGDREIEVLVPDIGDASGVVVIEIAVSPGDQVAVDDLLVVLESDKASMEIAAEQAGEVIAVAVEEGQEVEQGSKIATLRVSAGAAPAEVESVPGPATPVSEPPAATVVSNEPATAAAVPAAASAADEAVLPAKNVYAGPAVRRLARELGVDLGQVTGTGNRQRITKDDVKKFVKEQMQQPQGVQGAGLPAVPSVDFEKFGATTLKSLTRIQQRGADNLHRAWVNLPHVTQHNEADITDMEDFRQGLKQEGEQRNIKVTPLAFIVKAVCHTLLEFPIFNASLHDDRQHLVVKDYLNIGMAVDTPEGLVVPVIKAADSKNIWQLSEEIAQLSDKARNKKLALDDLQGGTFSVSSLGALGGTGFTPIVNAPEVAILGVAKLQTKPLWDGQSFVPRKVLPLSLSYDHRVINGADGGRFMLHLTTVLEDIRRLAL